MFVFWAVGLRSHPCPIMAFAYIMYNIHILKLTKYFGWARVGTYLSKTFPVSYMFGSKNKLLGPKINLTLRENERQSTKYRFIAIGNAKNLLFSQKFNFEVVVRAICYRDRSRSFHTKWFIAAFSQIYLSGN